MTLPTISLTALALSILAWVLAIRQNRKLVQTVRKQKDLLDAYQASADEANPHYYIGIPYDGKIRVYRQTVKGKYIFKTCIKVFQDFNWPEAEELVEKLKE